MLHIVHITKMCPLNYFLSINYHVAHKEQKPKVQLQMQETNKQIWGQPAQGECVSTFQFMKKLDNLYTYLKLEKGGRATEYGGSEVQPE